jgi:hypothetical protein
VDCGVSQTKRINLALQGGGSHGAYSWGALDKFDLSWSFLRELRDLGRASAKEWLNSHFTDIGERQSLNVPLALRRTDMG